MLLRARRRIDQENFFGWFQGKLALSLFKNDFPLPLREQLMVRTDGRRRVAVGNTPWPCEAISSWCNEGKRKNGKREISDENSLKSPLPTIRLPLFPLPPFPFLTPETHFAKRVADLVFQRPLCAYQRTLSTNVACPRLDGFRSRRQPAHSLRPAKPFAGVPRALRRPADAFWPQEIRKTAAAQPRRTKSIRNRYEQASERMAIAERRIPTTKPRNAAIETPVRNRPALHRHGRWTPLMGRPGRMRTLHAPRPLGIARSDRR